MGRVFGSIQHEALTLSNFRTFVPYICAFVTALYSNGRALRASNVETVIIFRACSPLCVSGLDWLCLGRELPSRRSLGALLGVLVGAMGYVSCDGDFALHGVSAYGWVSLNLICIVFEMTYGKQLISKVTFTEPVWGSVLYTNSMALLPMLLVSFESGELHQLNDAKVGVDTVVLLLVSCAVGTGISWTGWNCRSKITATAYTLLGVTCKFLSIALNLLIWDKHATLPALFWLGVCLISSTLYQQAPLRTNQTYLAA
eukprot:CAMPEP_0170579380 /NCGR_PEP_ID=MMETSP0224-20130122/5954_1 /TAXON_ID=285029 /ORGANISM="Togula jolla, Strain CCCM 725" /LENGTH=256 /DNA_ID=CAMNT_0010902403 /DNA_START=179 /DNA_END=949 /DNA_ORIENTATION=+